MALPISCARRSAMALMRRRLAASTSRWRNCSVCVRSSAISSAETGTAEFAALKRHDGDVVNGARRIFRLVTERPHGRAGLQDLINLRAEHLRQIAEFQFAGALVFAAEMAARGLVGVKHLQVAPDDDAGAAQFAQHVGHHLVVAGQLVVQPDVAERQADLFEQMENQFQFGVDQRFAGDAAVENGDADDCFAVEHRARPPGRRAIQIPSAPRHRRGLRRCRGAESGRAGQVGRRCRPQATVQNVRASRRKGRWRTAARRRRLSSGETRFGRAA